MSQPLILVLAIPVMPFESLLARDHLAADGAKPVLLVQDVGATWRRRWPRQLSVTVLEVRLPGGIAWMGVPLDLQMTLRFDGLLRAEDLCAGVWLGNPPRLPHVMGKGAGCAPASGVVGVAPFGPSAQPPPHEAIELGESCATDDVAVIVRPASYDGVEGTDELRWRAARPVLAKGLDPGVDGLETGLARDHLERGRFALGPRVCAQGLPSEVKALRDRGADGLRRRQSDASCGETGVDARQDRVV